MTGPAALLALEDGTVFRGSGFGADGEAFGEAVFNTGMAGYQEVLTDPSYAGQIVTMTAPMQGNYGLHADDAESERIQVSAFAVTEASRRSSSRHADATLGESLAAAGVVAIEGIDTRKLTRRIRDVGAMRAGVSTRDLDPASLVARVRETPGMAGAELASSVTTLDPYEAEAVVGPADRARGPVRRVAVYDFGLKRNILRMLAAAGLDATVLPGRGPRRRSWPRAASTASSCRTGRETPRRRGTGSPPRRRSWARSRCSGSASGISCWGWRSGAARTRCRSAIAV